jgi:hypothetical protein
VKKGPLITCDKTLDKMFSFCVQFKEEKIALFFNSCVHNSKGVLGLEKHT